MGAAVLALFVLVGVQQAPAPAPAQPTSPASSAQLPVSLDRIQRALEAPPPLGLKEQTPVFRLEVVGRKPTLEDLLGERFWLGPTPYGGMTHQEFLDMVTPQMARPYGGFSGKYLAAEVGLALAQQWALRQAIHKFKSALTDREREAARKEVEDALAALEKARRDAGLPPK